ncbi:MAG: methyltransferase domain-containing protein [Pyrinomonadaceae bacterium]
MFKTRSLKLERIDTGDYTPAEYARFLKEIAFINRHLGDRRALKKTLLSDVAAAGLDRFTVLDVGAGSGYLLKTISKHAARSGSKVFSVGLDLNEISARTIAADSADCDDISTVRGDALRLPFRDDAFDYAMCSLFTHHLNDQQIIAALREMSRVSRRGIYVIDLHRHPAAYVLYKVFCFVFRISPLVREDGLLSVLRAFTPEEFRSFSDTAGFGSGKVERVAPFRITLTASKRRKPTKHRSWFGGETDWT